MNTKFIQQIPFFSHLSEENLNLVLNEFKPLQFKKDDIIINQGDTANGMYAIIFGEVEVIRNQETIAHINDNGFFGEMALVANEPRSATVKVTSDDLSTFFLSKQSFEKIKNELGEEIKLELLKRISEDYN